MTGLQTGLDNGDESTSFAGHSMRRTDRLGTGTGSTDEDSDDHPVI